MMKRLNKTLLSLAVIGCSHLMMAQDVHFSQYEFSPMQLNPGLTGANAPMQVNLNYRSQWSSVGVPYTTIAASAEGRFNEKKRMKKGIIAGGLNFFNDRSGNLPLTSTKVNLNLAYHLILDRYSKLGLGLYGGFGQRTLDPNDGQWGSQYNGLAYDAALPSNEVFNSNQFSYMDVGTGLVYTYKTNEGYMTQNNQREITGGVAFYHVNTPNFSFINNEEEQLPVRWSVFVNALVGFQNSNGALMPGFYLNRQKTNMEILYGTYYRFMLSEGSKVTARNKPFYFAIGAFHRWGDALVAKTLLEWGVLSTGFSYDFNLSSLSEASRGRGGFELFLQYKMGPGGFSRASIR